VASCIQGLPLAAVLLAGCKGGVGRGSARPPCAARACGGWAAT